MGYTHYWDEVPTVSEACVKHIKRIVEDGHKRGILSYEDDSSEPPVADSDQVRFNGIGAEGHETFLLLFDSSQFEFCKTARKLYDLYVVAVLAAVEYHTDGAFKWRSDGSATDHCDGVKLMEKTLK